MVLAVYFMLFLILFAPVNKNNLILRNNNIITTTVLGRVSTALTLKTRNSLVTN